MSQLINPFLPSEWLTLEHLYLRILPFLHIFHVDLESAPSAAKVVAVYSGLIEVIMEARGNRICALEF